MLGKAGGDGADADAGAVQGLHGHLEAHAQGAEQRVGGQVDVVEGELAGGAATHAHLVLKLADGQALGVLRDDEGGDALVAGRGVGLGEDYVVVGDAGVGDPGLAAVEDPAAVVGGDHGGLDAGRVGARAGLGQAEGEDLALGGLGQILVLLRLGAVVEDEVGSQPVGVQEQGLGGTALGYLVDNYDAGDRVSAAAAVLLVQVYSHEAGLRQLLMQLVVKAVLVHPFVTGFDFLLGKFPYHVADHNLLFREVERHVYSSR